MAVIGTVIEAARVNTAQGMAQIALNTATDSILASYDRKLFDEYHIFGFDTGYGTQVQKEDQLKEDCINYMEYSIEAKKDLSLLGNKIELDSFDMYGIRMNDIAIDSKAMLTDYEGEIFLNEAVEYMKYKAGQDVIRNILEKLSLYQSSQETSEVLEKKLETEEALGELSEKMMDLMCQVEGIDLNEDGIKYTKSGKLKVKDDFAKRIVMQTPSMETLGINHELVYQSLKEKYYIIEDQCDSMIDKATKAISLLDDIKELERQKEELESQKVQLESELSQAREQAKAKNKNKSDTNKSKNGSKEVTEDDNSSSAISQLQSQIDSLSDDISSMQDSIDSKSEEKASMIEAVRKGKENLLNIQNTTCSMIDDALDTIEDIEGKREQIKGNVDDYEALLASKESELDPSVYDGLNEDLESMKRYTSDQEKESDALTAATVVKMKDSLQKNRAIIYEATGISGFSVTEDKIVLNTAIDSLKDIKNIYANYEVASLRFDYSSLVVDQEADNPVNYLSDLLQNGILSLVIDNSEELSDKAIQAAGLPSSNNSVSSDGEDQSYSDLLTECKDNEYNSEITGSFGGEEDSQKNSLTASIMNTLLLNEYETSHFENYLTSQDENDSSKTLPTALAYEQEYIASGKLNDKDNLKSVVTKIVFLRTIINFLHVYSDREKTMEAYTTATALVGFTCFSPLISLVKTVILLMWSFEEALVDASALLDGRSVPFFKTRDTFKINYTDLLCVNRELIKQRAELYEKAERNRKDFSYKDYLGLLYILNGAKKNCYRAMDLIQLNLSIRKGSKIQLSNYLYGYRVSVVATVPSKFVALKFIVQMLGEKQDSFQFRISRVNAY
jgi:predicted  nucleic acid-binding Zn-ribbon protein